MSALAKSISRVAWSYVFLYLDVNIGVDGGSLNLLPDFICYVLILYALPGLAIEERSAALLRPLAWILLVVEAVRWVLPVIGLSSDLWGVYLLGLVVSVASLYFHFQLLTNISDIAARFDAQRAVSIRRLRNLVTVFNTVMSIPWPVNRLGSEALTFAAFVLIVIVLIMIVWTFRCLFGLRRTVIESGTQDM